MRDRRLGSDGTCTEAYYLVRARPRRTLVFARLALVRALERQQRAHELDDRVDISRFLCFVHLLLELRYFRARRVHFLERDTDVAVGARRPRDAVSSVRLCAGLQGRCGAREQSDECSSHAHGAELRVQLSEVVVQLVLRLRLQLSQVVVQTGVVRG